MTQRRTDRLFEVRRDGACYTLPGGADIATFRIAFFCDASGPATLHVGGMRSRAGAPDFLEQLNDLIVPGDMLMIRYLASHAPPPPFDSQLMDELGRELRQKIKAFPWPRRAADDVPAPPESRARRSFQVELDGMPRIIAAELRGSSSQLSASVDWNWGRCTLSVHSVFVLPGGETESETFLATELQPGQELKLTLLD